MQFPPHRKSLLNLLADGEFHSGTRLAEALGLSRSAVWGLIHGLQELGLEINAVSGKGYRLSRPLELLDSEKILSTLSAATIAQLGGLNIHDSLDSTNTHLVGQAAAGAAQGSVCLAEFQTAGRGRIGRVWQSPFGGNICLSLLWRFDDSAAVAGLSLAVGVAIIRALRQAGVADAHLKWPNDVLWQGRKLGGILLEVSGEAHGGCAVVIGIGLNRSIPASAATAIDQPWVDLYEICGGSPTYRNQLIALLLDELVRLLMDYPERGLRAYLAEWRQSHRYDGCRAVVELGGKAIPGVVAGISDEGLLVLDCDEGGRREFASGELRLRLHD
jgi:BirA family biotin operon repressor/biotin-[acetyl-CoA-carboxylase] ligase